MGLQYKNEHGDLPITLTVPNDASVKGYLVTNCVAANHDGSGIQQVTVDHDTVRLAQFLLAADNDVTHAETGNGSVPYGAMGQSYFERERGGGGALISVIPVTRKVIEALGTWLAPGDVFMMTGTNCRGSISYQEEI